jgi:CheY-like chemotaxis protein
MADIVIVDDDEDMADLLSAFLRTTGHDVRVGRNGAEGLELVRTHAPDAIVLDVEMPVMSGPDMAIKLLIHDCGLERIPLILCSGVLQLPQVAAEVGTPYFLSKPYALDTLQRTLSRVLVERTPPHASAPS